ncbi:MAG: pilus assembly protein [Sphingomonadales bacterium]|nr:pilus assembly protein [Sphingomonadales bacterium]MDE2567978.1 pilus assembly protein [Sphingomonadales bacterium]
MITVSPLSRRLRRFARGLAESTSGVAMIEFAMAVPVLALLGMGGAELANITLDEMKVSEIALSTADNASRLGQTDNSAVAPTISESDVDSVMQGANDAGASIGLANHGRVILSSLEKDPATGKQYIHWQRCIGAGGQKSRYGNDQMNNGLHLGQIFGMGRAGNQVSAPSTTQAVMYVEVYYDYQPLFGTMFTNLIGMPATIGKEAAFLVRDGRDLTPGLTGTVATSSLSGSGNAYAYGKQVRGVEC